MGLIVTNEKYPRKIARRADESAYPNLWNGLVGSWVPNLQKPNTSRLFDLSNYDNHGTLNGSMTFSDWVVGPRGYALDFDGVDDYINLNKRIFTDSVSRPMAAVAWVKATTLAGMSDGYGGAIVRSMNHTNGDPGDFWVGVSNNGSVKVGYYQTNADPTSLFDANSTQPLIVAGVWYQVGFIYDGANVQIILNGALHAVSTTSNAGGGWGVGAYLGRIYPAGAYHFNGAISNVVCYSRALSPSEILALYQGASPHTHKDSITSFGRNPTLYFLKKLSPYFLLKKNAGSDIVSAQIDYFELKKILEKMNRY